jgi:hypothetical protein
MIRAFVVLAAVMLVGAWFVDAAAAYVPDEYQPNYDEGYGVGYPRGYKSCPYPQIRELDEEVLVG